MMRSTMAILLFLLDTAIRNAENDIIARISERLESQADPLTSASAVAIARELMHL